MAGKDCKKRRKMLVNNCSILGDPLSIDSIHHFHRPWVISCLLFVLIYVAFWLVISVFNFSVRKSNRFISTICRHFYFYVDYGKFNLILSTMCHNFYFYLIYKKSNHSFQIKRDTRISLCY